VVWERLKNCKDPVQEGDFRAAGTIFGNSRGREPKGLKFVLFPQDYPRGKSLKL